MQSKNNKVFKGRWRTFSSCYPEDELSNNTHKFKNKFKEEKAILGERFQKSDKNVIPH